MPLTIYGLGVHTKHKHTDSRKKLIQKTRCASGLAKFKCVCITMCSLMITPFLCDFIETEID